MPRDRRSLADKEHNWRCNAVRPECMANLQGAARSLGVSLLIVDRWRRRLVADRQEQARRMAEYERERNRRGIPF